MDAESRLPSTAGNASPLCSTASFSTTCQGEIIAAILGWSKVASLGYSAEVAHLALLSFL